MTDENTKNLLPWYVNNTLTNEERQAVEDWLAKSSEAQEELKVLTMLQDQVKSEPVPEASELGWRRLQKEIRAEKSTEQGGNGNVVKTGWWKQSMAVAAALVIALQVGILSQAPSTDNTTRLLGEDIAGLDQPHWLVQIEFDASAPWQQISETLSEIDARVVDGPSGIGLVRVAVFKEGSQFASKDDLMAWLSQKSIVVHASVDAEK